MHGYQILLTGKKGWCLRAEEGIREWLDALAGIMGLERASCTGGYPILFKLSPGINYPPKDPPSYDFRSVRIWLKDDRTHVEVWNPDRDSNIFFMNMWWALFPVYLDVIGDGGLPIHGGLAGFGGDGVVIAGPGGTGKSTNIGRLPEPWKAYSDDESLIVPTAKGYYAHPFPTWSDYLYGRRDSRFRVSHSLPARAIFFLEQSHIDEVIPLNTMDAAGLLCSSALQVCNRYINHLSTDQRRRLRLTIFENACTISKELPSFILRVSRDGRFWLRMEEVIQ